MLYEVITHLSTPAETRGNAVADESQRNRRNRAHVGGDVLAVGAVSARRRQRENTILVDDLDRDSVHLGLA